MFGARRTLHPKASACVESRTESLLSESQTRSAWLHNFRSTTPFLNMRENRAPECTGSMRHQYEIKPRRKTMRSLTRITCIVGLTLAVGTLNSWAQEQTGVDKNAQWKPVQDAMGRPGKLQPDGTFKFGMPRKDMKVTVNGTAIQPGLALGCWTAFAGTPDHAMVMGDLVLTEDEVEPLMLKLQQEGIHETAVHNHLLHETPRVMYMHIQSHGNA